MGNAGNYTKRLSKASYPDIEGELEKLGTSVLVELLDSRSIKVGDSAADFLAKRHATEPVVDAVLSKRIRTKLGKMRASSIARRFGKRCPRIEELHLALVRDKHPDVVDWALFVMAFLQDERFIPVIKEVMVSHRESAFVQRCELAIEALKKQDPFIYSPYFRDSGDKWGLDRQRFGDKILDDGKA